MEEENLTAPLLSRRAFIHRGVLCLGGSVLAGAGLSATLGCRDRQAIPAVRFGLLTDLHFALKDPGGSRFYRESLTKIRPAMECFNQNEVQFSVELGDLIDSAESLEQEIEWLKAIDGGYQQYEGPRHFVFGNHCVQQMSKKQFMETTGMQDPFYSYDQGGFHFIVLDACYREDGVSYDAGNFDWQDTHIPPAELDWLKNDLESTPHPALIFVHQRLDNTDHHSVKNNAEVRSLLESSGKVLAVFQGHHHMNDLQAINGIHYCTLAAMVEGSGESNNAWAVVDVFENGSLRVDGFRMQKDYTLKGARVPATGVT